MQIKYERWRSEQVYEDALNVYKAVWGFESFGNDDTFAEFLGSEVERAAAPSKSVRCCTPSSTT